MSEVDRMPDIERSSDYNAPAATRGELEAEAERLRVAAHRVLYTRPDTRERKDAVIDLTEMVGGPDA